MRRKKDRSNGITALYERLSRDDDNAGESNSIVHQKQMLEDYAMKHGFTNLVHFTDDGWSGATFDRPSWNRLVEGVKNGEITACICKDMSRIGRDHLQVGFFTDILFREKEVRFIAINNGIDSDRQETSEFAPFLNIMNEWYAKDTSKKIKAVFKAKMRDGKRVSGAVPYGYYRKPEDKQTLYVDEASASVVRRIFQLACDGMGATAIADTLSEDKILIPSAYARQNHPEDCQCTNYHDPYTWNATTVGYILNRREYLGHTVLGKTTRDNFKTKRKRIANEDELLVFYNTHEAMAEYKAILEKGRQNNRKRSEKMRELRMSDPEYRVKMEEKERLALEREKKRQERATKKKKIALAELKEQAEKGNQEAVREIEERRAIARERSRKSAEKRKQRAENDPEYAKYLEERNAEYNRRHTARRKEQMEALRARAEAGDQEAQSQLAERKQYQVRATVKSYRKMREDALNGDPIAKERYEKTLAMRREAYHAKKSEQTA